jgi:hypothetical protein
MKWESQGDFWQFSSQLREFGRPVGRGNRAQGKKRALGTETVHTGLLNIGERSLSKNTSTVRSLPNSTCAAGRLAVTMTKSDARIQIGLWINAGDQPWIAAVSKLKSGKLPTLFV